MSAWVVSKVHVDLLVRAALMLDRESLSWWQVDDAGGGFTGWRRVDEFAEAQGPEEQERRGLVSPSQLGQLLVSENVRSVSHRYSEPGRTVYYGAEHAASMDDTPDEELPGPCDRYYLAPYVYENPGYTLTPGEIFGALSCFEYQSCEHDEWKSSEAFQVCDALRNLACSQLREGPHGWEASDLEGRALEFSRRII